MDKLLLISYIGLFIAIIFIILNNFIVALIVTLGVLINILIGFILVRKECMKLIFELEKYLD